MTREEAKQVFLSRGYVEVEGGTIYDANKWREACVVISEWLEQEPSGDAVSREDANKFLYERIERLNDDELYDIFSKIIDDMYNELPSVKPQEPTGHWILLDECSNSGYYCSECHKKVVKEGWSNTVKKIKYCPNCGCRMVEPQESEDKE